MVDTKSATEYPALTKSQFWTRKIRTLFRRIDSNGHGYLHLDDFIDIASSMVSNLIPASNTASTTADAAAAAAHAQGATVASLAPKGSYKGDGLVQAVMKLWFGLFCTHVAEKTKTNELVGEARFVDNCLSGLENPEVRSSFGDSMITPLFVAADADDDGKVTLGEFRAIMKCLKGTENDANRVFRVADKDHDGKITLQEFLDIMTEFFFSEKQQPANVTEGLFGPLVQYKRPEDYPTIECNPFWEGKMRMIFRRCNVSQASALKCHDFILIGRGIVTRGRLTDKKKVDAVMRAMLNLWIRWIAVDKEGILHTEVTEKEFLKNVRDQINGEFRHEIAQIGWTFFKALEVDGNGYLSLQEYRNLQEAWGVGREESEAMFKTIDHDKDGKISGDEYLNAWVEYFMGEDSKSNFKNFFGPIIVKHESRY